ncbi:MAG: DNA polymerase III subunit delta [Rhodospirillales bacterium]|nr:DNA polymerase III subunit delta [Rhodospirillales bacterium]
MKLAAGRLEAFLRRPDPAVCAVLIYGPDRGLVRERADALSRAVAGDPPDPFRLSEVSMANVREDPARLSDEMASLSLAGGARAVRLREATDAAAEPIGNAFARPRAGSLLIVEAGDLGKRSALRSVFEGAKSAIAIPCYSDDEAGVQRLAAAMLADARLSITDEAMAYLVAHLGGDRALTRGEIEKLIVYIGASNGGPVGRGRGDAESAEQRARRTVQLADVVACIGDSRESSLDAIAMAAAAGDVVSLDRALELAFASAVQPVSVIRAAARHLQRLHLAAGLVAAGRSAEQAMAALRPPVFYKAQTAFRTQLRIWTLPRLGEALRLVLEAELACKATGAPAQAIATRMLWRIAQVAAERPSSSMERCKT